jgi:hypothetical protein
MKIDDDVLNKFIDGELSESEMNEISELIRNSDSIRKNYNALLMVHQQLKLIKEENVSKEFTSYLMSKLNKGYKARKSDRLFIFSVSSIFIVFSLFIIGFLISSIITSPGSSSNIRITDDLLKILNNFSSSAANIFKRNNISIFGSVISLGILITAYFFFESNKNLKKN